MKKRHARLVILAAWASALASVAVVRAQTDPDEPPSDVPPEEPAPDETVPDETVPDGAPDEPPIVFDIGEGDGGEWDPCPMMASSPEEGLEATYEESLAWCYADNRQYIRARERAEAVLRTNPDSYVGHFVLAYVQHMGEANVPRALFEMRRAIELYTNRYGSRPAMGATPWRWHAQMVRQMAFIEADMEHYEAQLMWIREYNEMYRPEMLAESAWPLMKMRRFDEARAAAEIGRRSGSPWQNEVALNALCAIEFEAGDERRSYDACHAALMLHGGDPESQSAVDFTNFAEAARSLFLLDEAETNGLAATEAEVSWYGNPYVELGELYLREGRFSEALAMMREVHPYRLRRPPHVQDADRNEARRALSELFLLLGRGPDAIEITERALFAPDRRGHNSRDPAQDLALTALLDRAARDMEAEHLEADAVGAPFFEQIELRSRALLLRVGAWQSGREAVRALADDERLVGIVQIGRSRSAVMPPYMVGDLVRAMGAGVMTEAIRQARTEDPRPEASAYYDAFEAECALLAGDPARAYELSRRSLDGLGSGEALLRARASAISALAARDEGYPRRALEGFDEAFQIDPGVFVRMGAPVPVRILSSGGDVADEVASILAWSPRFDVADEGLSVAITTEATGGEVCFSASTGAVLACADLERDGDESDDTFALRLARAFTAAAFAPQVPLSATDVSSLDGSNSVSRGGLDELMGDGLED